MTKCFFYAKNKEGEKVTLNGLFKSRDKPSNKTNGSAYSFLMSGSSSRRRVYERSAMQMTAVYIYVRILSETVANFPLHLYLKTKSGIEKENDGVKYSKGAGQAKFNKF